MRAIYGSGDEEKHIDLRNIWGGASLIGLSDSLAG